MDKVFFPTFFFLKMKPADSATRNCGKEKGLTPFPEKGAGTAAKLTFVGTGTDGKAV